MGGDTISRPELRRRIAFFEEQGDYKEASRYRATLTQRREWGATWAAKSRADLSNDDKKRQQALIHAYWKANSPAIKKKREALKKDNKQRAMDLLGGSCADCGIAYPPAVMEFHHKDKVGKRFTISQKMAGKWESIIDEVKKCVLLCANCHRIRHTT